MPSGHISCLPRNDDCLIPVICSKRSACTQSINPPPFCITSISWSITCGILVVLVIFHILHIEIRAITFWADPKHHNPVIWVGYTLSVIFLVLMTTVTTLYDFVTHTHSPLLNSIDNNQTTATTNIPSKIAMPVITNNCSLLVSITVPFSQTRFGSLHRALPRPRLGV